MNSSHITSYDHPKTFSQCMFLHVSVFIEVYSDFLCNARFRDFDLSQHFRKYFESNFDRNKNIKMYRLQRHGNIVVIIILFFLILFEIKLHVINLFST